jgi:hypothetical protein
MLDPGIELPDCSNGSTYAGAGAETQRGFEALDGEIGLARPQSAAT